MFGAEATLPEIGWTHVNSSVRVFINDIDVRVQAKRTDEAAYLTVNVNTIVLDRINNGTAKNGWDYLHDPVEGKNIRVEILRVYWERERQGEFYCFIERAVVPRYWHVRREEVINNFEIMTNHEGEARADFTVPNRENESYVARISVTDGNGRIMNQTVFIGRDFSHFFNDANDNRLRLEANREWDEGYDMGNIAIFTVMRGTEPVSHGNFLFVTANNGIIHYQVGVHPYAFHFREPHMPGATVYAFWFNGHTYHSDWGMQRTVRFNSASRELNIDISMDRGNAAYRPGETAVITVKTTDPSGSPKPASVNISVVDEALFALRDYSVDTLASLYRTVNCGIRHRMASHGTFSSDGITNGGFGRMVSESLDNAMPPSMMATAAPGMGGGAGQTYIREVFEDTALFAALRTNENGEATFTFRLPDNITSWRLTASGVSTDLYAGNEVRNIVVTNPMFIHYSLNDIFLVGDTPTIGVNVYGTGLTGGEEVLLEIWDERNTDIVLRARGTAFERINIPLWVMTQPGDGALIIRAVADSRLSDAVRHPYQVITSHRQIDRAVFYGVTVNTGFDASAQGMTDITFIDQGRGQFLSELSSMRWIRGARVESLVMRREANRLIQTYFPDLNWSVCKDTFNPRDYQTPNGGMTMLPHAEADLTTTIRIMPFILDDINVNNLTNYLYRIYEGSATDNKMHALYGLAMLKEPVLLDLRNYARLEGLPIRDIAYIALGFAALGETETAAALYNERIKPHMQHVAPYYRVNTGETRADILEATSVVALLAAQLGTPERLGLHQYTVRNHNNTFITAMHRLSFIAHEIGSMNPAQASITYTLFGQTVTRDLSGWRSFTLRIPTQNLHEFRLTAVTGDVGAVSIHRTPLEHIETIDNDITITRQYFRAGETVSRTSFEQGDLVRVQLTVDFSKKDMTGSYQITDFLPAGLVHVSNSSRFGFESARFTTGQWRHVSTEGQRVSFFEHNSRFNTERVFYYYARVISPGTFKAEGTIVQNISAREYLTVGADSVITIRG
jgi:hypothetical protein